MSYDPTKPANNSPVSSAELRSQFSGLKDLIDTKLDGNEVQAITAGAVLPVNYLSLSVSDPPTQAEVQSIADKLNEVLTYLRRE